MHGASEGTKAFYRCLIDMSGVSNGRSILAVMESRDGMKATMKTLRTDDEHLLPAGMRHVDCVHSVSL